MQDPNTSYNMGELAQEETKNFYIEHPSSEFPEVHSKLESKNFTSAS